jgi:hypothetical protein
MSPYSLGGIVRILDWPKGRSSIAPMIHLQLMAAEQTLGVHNHTTQRTSLRSSQFASCGCWTGLVTTHIIRDSKDITVVARLRHRAITSSFTSGPTSAVFLSPYLTLAASWSFHFCTTSPPSRYLSRAPPRTFLNTLSAHDRALSHRHGERGAAQGLCVVHGRERRSW